MQISVRTVVKQHQQQNNNNKTTIVVFKEALLYNNPNDRLVRANFTNHSGNDMSFVIRSNNFFEEIRLWQQGTFFIGYYCK